MFDPSKFTILTQAAGGSGDWRIWHYVAANGETLEEVSEDGFFSPMASHITPLSVVYVVAPGYVAHLVMAKHADAIRTVSLGVAEVPAEADLPHVQGVPNQPGGNMPIAPADEPHDA